ncbi:hypothetical protein KAJ27_16845, partial [bacterium]|nr:hypothetical protein [bacterium]
KHQGAGEHFIELVMDIFETLNSRIRFLYDQDHQLGHAYFLNAVNYESLRLIFTDRIIPLLQEYFYGAWDKICIVLGCPYDENGNPLRDKPVCVDKKYLYPVIYAKKFFEEEILGFDHDEYEDRIDFEQAKDFKKSDIMPKTLIPYLIGILTFKDPDEYQTRILQLEKETDDIQENKQE